MAKQENPSQVLSPVLPGDSNFKLAEVLTSAIARHYPGNRIEARRLGEAILSAAQIENRFDALHYLGVLEAQGGLLEEASYLLRAALKINAESAEAHLNYGNVLAALNRVEHAIASYEWALAIRPDYPEALSNLGGVLLKLKRPAEALASYDRALAIAPDHCLDIPAHCLYNYSPATRYARCPVRINLSRRYAAGYSVLMCNQDVSACMHHG